MTRPDPVVTIRRWCGQPESIPVHPLVAARAELLDTREAAQMVADHYTREVGPGFEVRAAVAGVVAWSGSVLEPAGVRA